MALGKGIPVINGFDLNSKLPLDSRAVADTMEEMNKLVTDSSVGDGQLCYCKEDKKLYVLKDNVWTEVGGGGKSVPPTLNLMDFSGDIPVARTSITEEEYNNLKNGLYNQVIYGNNIGDNITPNRLFCLITGEGATIYFTYLSADENGTELVGLNAYSIDLGEKNNNNQYPITINTLGVTPFGTNIPNINATATAINNLYQLSKSPTSSFVMNINESNDVHKVLMNYVYDGNRYYCYGIESIINNIVTYYASNPNEQNINIYKHTLYLNNTDSKTISLFGKHSILVPKDSADISIIPCTTADNGKVLSVVDGEAQWTKIDVNSYPYITGRINASDTQTSSFPKTDSETRVVTIENLDLSKLLNTKTIIVDADADASEVFNIACGAYGETEGIGTYVSSISCDKKTNNLFFFYINVDIQTSSFIIKRKTIPTSTNTITFED